MRRFIKDLYDGKETAYYLFWDNGISGIGRTIQKRNGNRRIEILPQLDQSIKAQLDKLEYAGEGINVVLFGPAAIQKIEKLNKNNQDVSDWIIEHKDRIFPTGINEDETKWDYQTISSGEDRYLCFSISRKETVSNISTLLAEQGLRIDSIGPLIGFVLDNFGTEVLFAGERDFPIKIPGTRTAFVKTDSGFLLNSFKESKGLENEIDEPNIVNSNVRVASKIDLFYEKVSRDLLSKVHLIVLNLFKPVVRIASAFLILIVCLNVLLAYSEGQRTEQLSELQFLQYNLENINNQISVLKKQHSVYEKLTGYRSNISPYLNAIAIAKPSKVWWRKLDYDVGRNLSIEGFCLGDDEAAAYYRDLSRTGYFGSLEIAKIVKYPINKKSKIPRKYNGNVYKYKLDIGGVG